jgi:enoyl-CoA hydratase/carnithine racemase
MSELKVEQRGAITVMTLNRPERHNSLTLSLAAELKMALDEFNADETQKVLIITGAGDKAFCSGADLKAMAGDLKPMAAQGGRPSHLPLAPEPDILGIAACEKPVIAALNGLTIGGGLEIALCCDIRLAADHVWFALPEPSRGFIAGVAAMVLPRLMPIGAALDMMLTGERMSVEEAYRLGLVQKILPREKLMEEAERKAQLMCAHSRSALAGTKKVLRFWRDIMLTEQHHYYTAVIHRGAFVGRPRRGPRCFPGEACPQLLDRLAGSDGAR